LKICCTIWHPFDETIIYAVDINVGGLSGSVDVTLATTNSITQCVTNSTVIQCVTNSTIYVASIDTNTLQLEIDRDSVTVDTVTNNRLDVLLALSGLPEAPLILGASSLAEIEDVASMATSFYGFAQATVTTPRTVSPNSSKACCNSGSIW
jgi:repressor of nif and glnA expression